MDPNVAASIRQGRAQSENRLIAAMQESGATGRTLMQEGGATARTGMQIQGQLKMQAAELEAKDRQMAEAEAARRDDNQHSRLMQEERQQFLAEQNRLSQEWSRSKEKRDRTHEKKVIQMGLDNMTLQGMVDAEADRQRNKVILAMATMGQQKLSGQQKLVTAFAEEAEKSEENQRVHEHTLERVKDGALLDKRLDLPIAGERYPATGFGAKLPAHITPRPDTAADPMSVLQDQARGHGSKINMGDLRSDRIHLVEKQIAEKNLDVEDVRVAVSALEGMKLALTTKRDEAPKGEFDFWDDHIDTISQMRLNLSQMMYNTSKIGESKVETVGGVVRHALGPIDGISTGSRIAKMKAFGTSNADAAKSYIESLRESIEVPGLLTAPEGASPYLADLVARRNQGRQAAYPAAPAGGDE